MTKVIDLDARRNGPPYEIRCESIEEYLFIECLRRLKDEGIEPAMWGRVMPSMLPALVNGVPVEEAVREYVIAQFRENLPGLLAIHFRHQDQNERSERAAVLQFSPKGE